MKSVKQQFIEFRTTTPKHIQWLLLVAAFIVVLILLTLLIRNFTGKNKKEIVPEEKTIEWLFKPTSLDFKNVDVGDKKQQTLEITVNDIVFIESTKIDDTEFENDWTITGDCDKKIDNYCEMTVIYAPSSKRQQTATSLSIKYHLPDNEDSESKEIPVIFSANEIVKEIPKPKSEPVVVEKTEPKLEPVVVPEPEPEPVIEEKPEIPDVKEEISMIAPEKPFVEPEPEPDIVLPSEKCSDFAIPGYNQSGMQIGWIKPTKGANYFHPFSDKDCTNPTGKYDWTTGIITSLKDGSKIGTDAEHIGYRHVKNRGLTLPSLSAPSTASLQLPNGTFDDSAVWSSGGGMKIFSEEGKWNKYEKEKYKGSAAAEERIVSSRPYDRTFILRQFKPIPATIVSEVRADPSVYGCDSIAEGECSAEKNHSIPVRATVDRNVYSDDGRTIIVPTGTLLMGYLEGKLPGPYQSFGRMNIRWYQFIRPDGVEFNFPNTNTDPYSGDAQGRVGVPGRGSTDYVEQMVIPILTAMVPAAVNMIAPIADTFVNQINLDNNTVVQSGTMRSSEMAKQDIINTWNRITNKLVVDAISNTVPPFSIPAGTRINVYSPVDLVVTCGQGEDAAGKKCAFEAYDTTSRRKWSELKKVSVDKSDASWVGQVRSWSLDQYCDQDKDKKWTIGTNWAENTYGYDYRTILVYCESKNYVAKNNLRNEAYSKQEVSKFQEKYGTAEDRDPEKTKAYNEDILGLKYADDGETILNPFAKPANQAPEEEVLTCDDGSAPDANGCCTGETYTDMGEQGFNCCPDSGGDCFPPITVE